MAVWAQLVERSAGREPRRSAPPDGAATGVAVLVIPAPWFDLEAHRHCPSIHVPPLVGVASLDRVHARLAWPLDARPHGRRNGVALVDASNQSVPTDEAVALEKTVLQGAQQPHPLALGRPVWHATLFLLDRDDPASGLPTSPHFGARQAPGASWLQLPRQL